MKITLKDIKGATGFALIGVVLSGFVVGLIGGHEYTEELKASFGVASVVFGKFYLHAF